MHTTEQTNTTQADVLTQAITKNNSHDAVFLEQTLKDIQALSNAIPGFMVSVKNLQSEIIYFSQAYANFLGFTPQDIIGKTTFEPLYDSPQIEQTLLHEDQLVIEESRTIQILKINRVHGSLKPYICIKFPIVNPDTHHVVGIMLQGLEIGILNFGQHLIDSYRAFAKHNPDQPLPHLSRREQQAIFLFMHHLTSQEIADIIGRIENKKISKSTIDSLFNDQLYVKFQVGSRVKLMETLLNIGYNNFIPDSLLNSGSQVINNKYVPPAQKFGFK